MLSKEDNEAITRTGPGTLMGNLFRQYWVPALLSSELPRSDSEPVRVMLLGEQLIAFRETSGQVGLVQNNCPHRGASLFFGRNEESGLRCVYHGWKFATDGTCVDMPNEPAESDFKSKVRATAYPCQERGGIVWTYMGPRQAPPALPEIEGNMLPDGEWQAQAVQRECNWLQAVEGDFDTSHAGFLHSGGVEYTSLRPGSFFYYMLRDKAPRYAVLDTPGGVMYTGYRDAEAGSTYHRIAQFLLPAVSMTPTGVLGATIQGSFSVPMDDEHMLRFSMRPRSTSVNSREMYRDPDYNRVRLLPNSSDWYGRFRAAANASNDYELDRDLQRGKQGPAGYTGIKGVTLQDQAITESEGPIYDRTAERLGSSDVAIIAIRRRLLAAARALAEEGTPPPGVDDPHVFAVRSGGVILPKGADWVESTVKLREAFATHADVDPTVEGSIPR
jgi:phenylpropionate dioxygenase-like ring-hydroxylating dioxygenase large terminal subunit